MENLATLLTSVGTFVTSAIGWVTDVVALVASDPIIFLMVVCLPVAGYAVGYLKRLIRL